MDVHEALTACTGSEWAEGDLLKNWEKHSVAPSECEQAFFNRPLIAAHDLQHSQSESRYYLLGQTDSHRKLFLVFTVRGSMIRVISARDMSRKERKRYEDHG